MGGRCLGRTVENCADEGSGKTGLLAKVQRVRDLWSIRTIWPQLFSRVRHGPDAYEEESQWRVGSKAGRGGSETEKRPRRSIGERSREYKSQLNDGAVSELCETIDPGPVRSDELSNESSFHRQLRTH